MTRVLLIGNGAREHALAEAIMRSQQAPCLYSFMKANNPGIASLSEKIHLGRYDDPQAITAFAGECKADFAFVGPEEPLSNGVVDALAAKGIPAVGPTSSLARLETSKSFTRNLLAKYGIAGNPRFRNFTTMDGIPEFLNELEEVVLKPDGLTGGKGVLVQGDHFQEKAEAIKFCREIITAHPGVTIEEKLEGEEFSLQCLCDGWTVVATPPVQDHKRRFVGDRGPNTGGMGSYSGADHLLPFLAADAVADGLSITRKVAEALRIETGAPYKGVLYGGFMTTSAGVRLIEYNARFGDPEAMNILPLLQTDFIKLCEAIITGRLEDLDVKFEGKATVCKYVVPQGYGLAERGSGDTSRAARIEIGDTTGARLYYSSVDQKPDGLYMTSSRAIGVVGIAADIAAAESIAEGAVQAIRGPVDHRPDIGGAELIQKRIDHMKKLKNVF
ncbi:MAG: phosphoribosylamine--glycine ligase [Syntrophales bacterium]